MDKSEEKLEEPKEIKKVLAKPEEVAIMLKVIEAREQAVELCNLKTELAQYKLKDKLAEQDAIIANANLPKNCKLIKENNIYYWVDDKSK